MKKTMQRGFGGLGLLSILFWIGCIVSEAPLAEPEHATDGSALIGSWESLGKPGDEVVSTQFVFEKPPEGWPSRTLKVSSETRRTDGTMDRGQTIAYLVKVGDAEYLHLLNLTPEALKELDYPSWREKEVRDFQIWSIRRSDKAFELFAADQEKLSATIEAEVSGGLDRDQIAKVRERLRKDGPGSIFQDQVFMKFDQKETPPVEKSR